MMELIIGGSGSGKSAYAEEEALLLSRVCEGGGTENGGLYYLATMAVSDAEGRQRVERHRRLRSGKGFVTIEQPRAVHRAFACSERGARTVLLECVSNLAANEMFSGAEPEPERLTAEKVVRDIERLRARTTHLVVVSNNVFEDGKTYDETTMAYIRAMGRINQELALLADRVVEVVVGLPIVLKEAAGCR
ncbi:MAG: bifunctional adenosylcobinamide kinase/adenosylcobinamide-phosphate guanylyltransferase [Roseburia sp.]|nr:bifunctional adenosylcobinamide kinase/adenosylcobinamide-phosphate guanylyltransferase [Roseburia sp.]